MPRYDDDEPVLYEYGSSHNISMCGGDEIGYTWGEWRAMSEKKRDEAMNEIVFELVDVWIPNESENIGE